MYWFYKLFMRRVKKVIDLNFNKMHTEECPALLFKKKKGKNTNILLNKRTIFQ